MNINKIISMVEKYQKFRCYPTRKNRIILKNFGYTFLKKYTKDKYLEYNSAKHVRYKMGYNYLITKI